MDAARKAVMSDATVSDEARERINSARIRDLSFGIRRIVGDHTLASEDIEQIARTVLSIADRGGSVTFDSLVTGLINNGRSKHKAEELAHAVFR